MNQTLKKHEANAEHHHHHHAHDLAEPMQPRLFRVLEIWREVPDTFTMTLTPVDGGAVKFAPGQFNMLYVFGVGEVPISISGDPAQTSVLIHTTRAVGKVSQALSALKAGCTVGVRGPFGTDWPIAAAAGMDVVFVAGGIGMAPLRPAIYEAMNNRKKFGNLIVLYGARTPEDILFAREVAKWRGRFDIDVQVTVDRSTGHWQGRVGLVTELISGGGFDPDNTMVFTCGPEGMMRGVVNAFLDHGQPSDRIFLSMERNMKCAVGFCGHCQLGSQFVCRDGPVFRFDKIIESLKVREL
jgi:NAD(P)H-flavin reductase